MLCGAMLPAPQGDSHMAKQAPDLSLEGHINGDADGFGVFRGIGYCLLIEGAALVGFAFGLWLYWRP